MATEAELQPTTDAGADDGSDHRLGKALNQIDECHPLPDKSFLNWNKLASVCRAVRKIVPHKLRAGGHLEQVGTTGEMHRPTLENDHANAEVGRQGWQQPVQGIDSPYAEQVHWRVIQLHDRDAALYVSLHGWAWAADQQRWVAAHLRRKWVDTIAKGLRNARARDMVGQPTQPRCATTSRRLSGCGGKVKSEPGPPHHPGRPQHSAPATTRHTARQHNWAAAPAHTIA